MYQPSGTFDDLQNILTKRSLPFYIQGEGRGRETDIVMYHKFRTFSTWHKPLWTTSEVLRPLAHITHFHSWLRAQHFNGSCFLMIRSIKHQHSQRHRHFGSSLALKSSTRSCYRHCGFFESCSSLREVNIHEAFVLNFHIPPLQAREIYPDRANRN